MSVEGEEERCVPRLLLRVGFDRGKDGREARKINIRSRKAG